MRLTGSIPALLAIAAMLSGLFALDAATAAAAHPLPHRAKRVALSGNVNAGDRGVRARSKRRLQRSRAKHAVSDAVSLAPRPQSAAAAATVNPELLFNGSRIGDFDQIQAAPGAIAEVPDPAGSGETVLQMDVDDSDVYPVTPTENPRAQAISPAIIDPGDEFWLQTKFMLPQDLPAVHGWMSLVAIYGAPFNGSGPWEIGVSGNNISWQRNGTYDYDVPWQMPLVKGRWVSVLLHERFAHDGWVEMWIDGQQVSFPGAGQRLAMQTMDSSNDGGANAAKIMQYREAGMFDSASVYFGSLKVGTSRTAVGG
jgi:hypothetical protein